MKPILIISPHIDLEHVFETKLAQKYTDVDVKLALLDEAIEIVTDAEKSGVEVIISRGGTARIIEKHVSIPVVEINVSPYDILTAIYSAKKYGNNIAVIGFYNIIHNVELLGPILDLNIYAHNIIDKVEAENYLIELINSEKKVDVLLGGTVAQNLAEKYDIPTILLKTSPEALELSIKEAKKLVEVGRKEKEKTQQFKAVLDYINEAVISVDSHGIITTFNSAAEKIIGVSLEQAIGKYIDDIIKNSKLSKVMNMNQPELGEILQFGKNKVVSNRVPIVVNDNVVGAVATFDDITRIQESEQRIRSILLNKGFIPKYNFKSIIGRSKKLIEAKDKAKKYALTDSTVLIMGESGTGKEMFAQGIHSESHRKNGPFVAVNCAAIPQNLLESELFGYEEGAFTGARKKGKEGLFIQAHGGTIFLDEIGEISIDLQARLLRVLQEREVMPVGSNKIIPIDVRIISATNKNLFEEVQKGNFRRDIYYRLNILKLHIPTLGERNGDIKLLSKYFVEHISKKYNKNIDISETALQILEQYHWPGNIRELENIIESLVVLGDKVIEAKGVKEILSDDEFCTFQHKVNSLEEVKKKHILKVLSDCKGNQSLAADKLEISRTHLWRLLKNI